MATPEQISYVRANTNEPEGSSSLTNEMLGSLIDEHGVDEAIAQVWDRKAATYSQLTDVSEAGASRKMSTLYKAAIEMADRWRKRAGEAEETEDPSAGRAKVHKISRS